MRFVKALLVTALFSASVYGQQLPANTTVLEIDSAVLGEKRIVHVRVPAAYPAQRAQRFPVLYMTDGDTQLGHTIATVEFLAREGRMPEMIVAAVLNTDRTRDLTPTKATMTTPDGREMNFPTAGGADKFATFFEREVIPRVDKEFRTQPFRIFAGHSFGGLFAMHLYAKRPALFNAYIAVSPTLIWDNNYPERVASESLPKNRDAKPLLYVSMGDEGERLIKSFEALRRVLETKAPKGTWTAKFYPDEDHGSIVMPTHYDGLRKIFDGWQLRLFDSNGRPIEMTLAAADEHYTNLSTRFGYKIATPEGLINQLGYRLLGANKTAAAIDIFRTNTERYPESANVYDSLGEALEASGRLNEAKVAYARAYSIGTATNDRVTNIFKQNLDRVSAALAAEAK